MSSGCSGFWGVWWGVKSKACRSLITAPDMQSRRPSLPSAYSCWATLNAQAMCRPSYAPHSQPLWLSSAQLPHCLCPSFVLSHTTSSWPTNTRFMLAPSYSWIGVKWCFQRCVFQVNLVKQSIYLASYLQHFQPWYSNMVTLVLLLYVSTAVSDGLSWNLVKYSCSPDD